MKSLARFFAVALISVVAYFPGAFAGSVTLVDAKITPEEVVAAQSNWAEALIEVGALNKDQGIAAATKAATALIDTLYGYDMGAVLFKPTLAEVPQSFRTTREGAISYFVGQDPNFPDQGFALKGWTKVDTENAAMFINGDTALAMGYSHFHAPDGTVVTVEKTWGFHRDSDGQLKIIVHHSSLPYVAQ